MAAYTIVLEGAAGVTAVAPRFDFTGGSVAVEVEDAFIENLTSGVRANIPLLVGEKIEYICSDWDAVTRIDLQDDKVSGDVSVWTLPTNLAKLYLKSTSVSGDISSWVLPNIMSELVLYLTPLSGDISGWTLPDSLVLFRIFATSFSGDISGWVLPNNLTQFHVYNTSLSGDISGWTLPNNLATLTMYTTSLDYDSPSGAFTGVTDNLSKIDFDNCNLTQSQVDNVLADLVASGIDNSVNPKTIEIGDNNSKPSISGLIDKVLLEARGWTTKITAVSTVYTDGLIDDMMFFNRELGDAETKSIYSVTRQRYGV